MCYRMISEEGSVARRLTLILTLVLLAALAGCTPGGQETPTPEPTVYTPLPTPTPSWNAEEQGAIDAVQNYLQLWAYCGQNIGSVDLNQIRDVAWDPEANHDLLMWGNWADQGWHLVGAPEFTPQSVIPGVIDSQGQSYDVYGCYVITDSYIADANGNSVGDEGRQDRGVGRYRVLHTVDDKYFITESDMENETC